MTTCLEADYAKHGLVTVAQCQLWQNEFYPDAAFGVAPGMTEGACALKLDATAVETTTTVVCDGTRVCYCVLTQPSPPPPSPPLSPPPSPPAPPYSPPTPTSPTPSPPPFPPCALRFEPNTPRVRAWS